MKNKDLLTFLNGTFINNFNSSVPNMCSIGEIMDMYHGNVWTKEELDILRERHSPAEQFNVVAMFAHQLLGYYSRTIATTKAMPRTPEDANIANILNDVVAFDNETSNWASENNELILHGLLTGYAVARVKPNKVTDVDGTVLTDKYNREHITIDKSYVQWDEVVLDSSSIELDYSDASFIHVMHWLKPSDIRRTFGSSYVSKIEDVESYLDTKSSTEPYSRFRNISKGNFNNAGKFLVVHSVIKGNDGHRYSIYWTGDIILSKVKLEEGDLGDYIVTKIVNDKHDTYSIFKSTIESVKAINQALIQIHMLVNANKIFYVDGAIETKNDGLKKFMNSVASVNSLTKVKDINGIKFENLSGDVIKQYTIIDKALQRIQLMLGINDSFLGIAYASDSGVKVKQQAGATIMSLDYLTKRLVLMEKQIGTREFKLIQKHMIAERVLRIDDSREENGYRWVTINSPILREDGKPEVDKGNGGDYILNTMSTDLLTANVDYITKVTSYIDENQVNQMMLETVANGNAGQFLMQASPADYASVLAESIKLTGTRSSQAIAEIFSSVSDKIANPQDPAGLPDGAKTELGGQPSNAQEVKRVQQ